LQGFRQRGDKSPSNDSRGISPLNLTFWGNFVSGFENLITNHSNAKVLKKNTSNSFLAETLN
jgi:hypothetical protein